MIPLLLCSLALASAEPQPWSLDLGVQADLPVSTGVQAVVQLPGRLRVGAGIGRLPGPVVGGATGLFVDSGALDAASASVLTESLGDARVLGASLGWRPFERAGLWLSGDLRHLRSSSEVTPELISTALAVEGAPPVPGPEGGPEALLGEVDPFRVTLHAMTLGGSLGWDQLLGERVVLRVSAGGSVLRSTHNEVEPGETARAVGPEQQLADEASAGLDALLADRLFVPTLGLGLGWRFGG